MADTRYVVVVSVHDPHAAPKDYGRPRTYTEIVYAPNAREAARIARSRHVGGRFTERYVIPHVIGGSVTG